MAEAGYLYGGTVSHRLVGHLRLNNQICRMASRVIASGWLWMFKASHE